MGIDVGQLVLVIVGALLALVTTTVANRQVMRNSLLVARDQRIFDLRREAFKAANEAWNAAEELRSIDRTKITIHMIIEMSHKILDPIVNSRDACGLDTRSEEMVSLGDSFYGIFEVREDKDKFLMAIDQFMRIISEHYDEIRDAWKRTLEGK